MFCGAVVRVLRLDWRENESPGTTSEERLICRSMRCAAGLAPRNLLFPTWLPGTAVYVTPEVIACQTALADLVGPGSRTVWLVGA